MAALTATNCQGTGAKALTANTLTSSDTFVYRSGVNQTLVLVNGTAGALTPNIDGAGGTTVTVGGLGDVSVAAGLTLASIGVGAAVTIKTETIREYLKGVVTITGGVGITAYILEY